MEFGSSSNLTTHEITMDGSFSRRGLYASAPLSTSSNIAAPKNRFGGTRQIAQRALATGLIAIICSGSVWGAESFSLAEQEARETQPTNSQVERNEEKTDLKPQYAESIDSDSNLSSLLEDGWIESTSDNKTTDNSSQPNHFVADLSSSDLPVETSRRFMDIPVSPAATSNHPTLRRFEVDPNRAMVPLSDFVASDGAIDEALEIEFSAKGTDVHSKQKQKLRDAAQNDGFEILPFRSDPHSDDQLSGRQLIVENITPTEDQSGSSDANEDPDAGLIDFGELLKSDAQQLNTVSETPSKPGASTNSKTNVFQNSSAPAAVPRLPASDLRTTKPLVSVKSLMSAPDSAYSNKLSETKSLSPNESAVPPSQSVKPAVQTPVRQSANPSYGSPMRLSELPPPIRVPVSQQTSGLALDHITPPNLPSHRSTKYRPSNHRQSETRLGPSSQSSSIEAESEPAGNLSLLQRLNPFRKR